MDTLAGQILWQSLVVPGAIAGAFAVLIRRSTHRSSGRLLTNLGYAAAFLIAIGASYQLTFGELIPAAFGARQKIILLAFVGLALGLGLSMAASPWPRLPMALLIAGPVWIGWPALNQGRPIMVLIILPIAFGLFLCHELRAFDQVERTELAKHPAIDLITLLGLMAVGLVAIAVFARTFSLAQLALALASTLWTARLVGGQSPAPATLPTSCPAPTSPPALVLVLAGGTMLSGLLSALVLYSQPSLIAVAMLSTNLALPSLIRVLAGRDHVQSWISVTYLLATIVTLVAVGAAWIDAGSFSVYEGAQDDRGLSRA